MLKDFQNVSCVLGHPIHVTQSVSVHSNELEEERADCFTFIVCEKGFINVQDSLFNVPLIGLWGLCVCSLFCYALLKCNF